jgi:hypothetical protein
MATLGEQAVVIIQKFLTISSQIPQDNAADALAQVCVMLTPYGSKPEAMLSVIHDKGWPQVTLNDVQQVREFILTQ